VRADAPMVSIDCSRPLHEVPATLFGIFFEEINHAGDGGLYAELLRNRAFEEPGDGDAIPGWSLAKGAHATMRRDASAPCQPQAPTALRIDVAAGTAVVQNGGFFGVPVHSQQRYRLRLDARWQGTAPPALRAELRRGDGTAIATAPLGSCTAAWQRLSCELLAPATVADGVLLLLADGPGTLWLDTVSLCPVDTFGGRAHGLRKDLVELLADLRPAFVRFPGGCFVEGGDRLADAFRWENTLGDVAGRAGHPNANWGYWSSDGLGFHEYLQLCEDLGALPLFVVNCGMSHKELVPLADLQPWIDSALAAIEYANGDASTPGGKQRAANGHAAPFGLRWVEIGNENGMFGSFGGTRVEYTERYRRFFDAIKSRWPDVTTIADTRIDAKMEIVDDHYYQSSAWFWDNAGRYDGAPRNGPKVYVGEYAVTHDPGHGHLQCALAEAAFLCGLLRNSDVVTMASYAPLFVHVQDRKWNPDLIAFDGLRSAPTPSYHVQRMFAAHRPDVLLPTQAPACRVEGGAGTIGLGTWNTHVEFADVEVEVDGKVVHRSVFADGPAGWQFASGDWKVRDGRLCQDADGDQRWCWLDAPALRQARDYTLRCKAKKTAGAEGFLLLVHVGGERDWTWVNLGGWGNHEHAIERCVAGSKSGVGGHVRGAIETGRTYDLRVECRSGRIKAFVDGAPVLEQSDVGPPTFAGQAGRAQNGDVVLFAVNGSEQPRRLPVVLRGAGALANVATGEVLTSGSLRDENPLEAPAKVAPRSLRATLELRRDGVDTTFEFEFAARSLTVLRLRPAD